MSLANVPTLFGLATCGACKICHTMLVKAGIKHNLVYIDFEKRRSEYLHEYPLLLLPSGERFVGLKEIRNWVLKQKEMRK